ncbi:DNA recombination protein RmuC [Aliagarivorans taiwanensis]|uniref:DNA recombination protein RmuC n=1 Tax=Aliagarivorans taiwanensis TaxID=561966 RepID=UPI00041EA273|nr:DNA recombination protein RmuC [Aliagarivorans taiwanensis]
MNIPLSSLYLVVFGALLLLVAVIALVVLSQRRQRELGEAQQQLAALHTEKELTLQELDQTTDALHHQQQQSAAMQQELAQLQVYRQQLTDTQRQSQAQQQQIIALEKQLAVSGEQEKTAQQRIQQLEQGEQRLQQQFEALANKVLESKQQHLQQQSEQGLKHLLDPLKEQLQSFRLQIQQNHQNEAQQRHSLRDQLLQLQKLNQQLSDDAHNLTRALKGDSKQQGNWGEVVLERILQDAGLRPGFEYQTQVVGDNQQGKVIKPDVVVKLPDDKSVVVDSKVSLTAYERFYNSEDPLSAASALDEHCLSLRNHIKGLARKDYQTLHSIQSLDYVLMFVPIESAYIAAVQHQGDLVSLALDSNILLVSPSSLMVALRTINNLWKMEYQQQNAKLIAARAGKLYDKFAAFTQDLQSHGQQLERAQESYQAALGKLSTGRGNLMRQAELLKEMHVPTNKNVAQLSDVAKVESSLTSDDQSSDEEAS